VWRRRVRGRPGAERPLFWSPRALVEWWSACRGAALPDLADGFARQRELWGALLAVAASVRGKRVTRRRRSTVGGECFGGGAADVRTVSVAGVAGQAKPPRSLVDKNCRRSRRGVLWLALVAADPLGGQLRGSLVECWVDGSDGAICVPLARRCSVPVGEGRRNGMNPCLACGARDWWRSELVFQRHRLQSATGGDGPAWERRFARTGGGWRRLLGRPALFGCGATRLLAGGVLVWCGGG